MNRFLCTGRLVRDPEIRYTSGSDPMAVARFSLAIDRGRKGRDGEPAADFPRFIAFGKTAELCEKYLHQGNRIEAEATVRTGSYTNKDGQTVFTTEFMIDRIGFLDSNRKYTGTGQEDRIDESEEKFMDLPDSMDKELPFR